MQQHLHLARADVLPAAADHHIAAFVERNAIPGASIAVSTVGGPTFTGAYGCRDLATGDPATPDTSYLWFSLTKVVTATDVRILADEGRLGLDDPVADLVPGLRGRRPGPTVRQVLNHTARYSNLGYLVLGAVIEAGSGDPFPCYVRRAILRPLGMDRTDFVHVQPALAATGYVKAPRAVAPLLRAVLPNGIVGPRVDGRSALNPFTVLGPSYGGLIGPALDAARFAAMHLNDGELDGVRILRPETAIDMRHISALGRQRDFGNGWFASAEHRATNEYVEHLGAGGGFYNAMRIYPRVGIGIVLMTNTTKAYDHHQLFDQLVETAWTSSTETRRKQTERPRPTRRQP